MGGVLGVFVAVLGIAGVIIILATVYAGTPAPGSVQGPEWSMTLYQSLLASTIGGAIDRSLIPALGALLGPAPAGRRPRRHGVSAAHDRVRRVASRPTIGARG